MKRYENKASAVIGDMGVSSVENFILSSYNKVHDLQSLEMHSCQQVEKCHSCFMVWFLCIFS